ncbi:MAG: beta-lactamase family protein [Streptococcus sp.]|nr:beta-lactamase family protein [Streptococcus sp.]
MKKAYLLIFLFVSNIGTIMAENIFINSALNQEEVEERIVKIENGLLPAIAIQGHPVSKIRLDQQMEHYGVPSVSIAVINNGQIEWAKSYGILEAKTNRAAHVSSLFQAGSVSKPVAAFGALSLVQNKTLDLNEDVNQRLISWKVPENEYTKLQKVSLKHLLSHTSGFNVIGFDGYRQNEKVPSLMDMLNGLSPANNPPVKVEFKPGERMSYSGGGYTVMQQLVEDTTNVSFADFMDSSVFKPLEMSRSTMSYPLPPYLSKDAAFAHPANGLPMEGGYKTYPESAAAGLWSTPIDISKWLVHIQDSLSNDHQSPILTKETLQLMLTHHIAPYGLGPVVNGDGKNIDFSHKGRTDGFACGFVAFPFLGKGVVVMINSDNGSCLVDEIIRGVSEAYEWPSYKTSLRKEIPISKNDLKECPGRYGTEQEKNDIYDVVVFEENGELFVRFGHASIPYKLHKAEENKFFLIETGFEVLFYEKDGATKKLVVVIQAGFDRSFNKFE